MKIYRIVNKKYGNNCLLEDILEIFSYGEICKYWNYQGLGKFVGFEGYFWVWIVRMEE